MKKTLSKKDVEEIRKEINKLRVFINTKIQTISSTQYCECTKNSPLNIAGELSDYICDIGEEMQEMLDLGIK